MNPVGLAPINGIYLLIEHVDAIFTKLKIMKEKKKETN